MSEIITLEKGRHVIKGGFSTVKKEDKELLRPLIEKNITKTIEKNWKGVNLGIEKVSKPKKASKSKKK